jgi:hypothetical protein
MWFPGSLDDMHQEGTMGEGSKRADMRKSV